MIPPTLLNYAMYQVGWVAAVVGAGLGYPWLGMGVALALLVGHFALARRRRAELRLAVAAGFLGLVIDSTQAAVGLLSFPTGIVVSWLCPPWIIVMWMQFATTFRFSLRWLVGRPTLAASFGAVGGPIAYMVGERLGAVDLGSPRVVSLLVLSLAWTVAVPTLIRLAGRDCHVGYRLPSSH